MTTNHEQAVAELHEHWIHGWDKQEGVPLRPFDEVFARCYDLDPDAEVILHDEADPERRTFRRVRDYADAFWPIFGAMRSAEHAIPEPPEVIVSGDLAVSRMAFVAVLTAADGTVTRLLCPSSHVWRRTDALGWRILRDQTAIVPIGEAQAASAFA